MSNETKMSADDVMSALDDVWSRGLVMGNVHLFDSARAAVAALIAEWDALREDAERYRWLRRDPAGRDCVSGGIPWVVMLTSPSSPMRAVFDARLDSTIDAARTNEST